MSEAVQQDWLWPLLVLLVSALATYAWRGLGVLLSGRINPNSALFTWLAAVAYALVAGLITRMIVMPIGPLEETPLIARLAAAGLCIGVYALTQRMLLAILVGGGTLAIWLAVG
ncbi:MAG: AzlD domain-containing protein [Pseudomonadota bacterium]